MTIIAGAAFEIRDDPENDVLHHSPLSNLDKKFIYRNSITCIFEREYSSCVDEILRNKGSDCLKKVIVKQKFN